MDNDAAFIGQLSGVEMGLWAAQLSELLRPKKITEFGICFVFYVILCGSGSKPCTPVVHIKIAGIYGCE